MDQQLIAGEADVHIRTAVGKVETRCSNPARRSVVKWFRPYRRLRTGREGLIVAVIAFAVGWGLAAAWVAYQSIVEGKCRGVQEAGVPRSRGPGP